jgi:glycerophosphoryl diester phosphodiesterase
MNNPSYTTLIAHRGESEDDPENTLPAYRTAVERGFGFECDCYLSADGEVFMFHDKNLARTTAGACTKACGEVTWDEIKNLDVGGWGKWTGSAFSGTHPALLRDVLPLARDGRRIYLEVKPGPEIVPHIKEIFEAQTAATPENLLFITFNRATCRALKASLPQFTTYLLMDSRHWAPGHWGDRAAPPVTEEEVLAALDESGADGLDFHYDPDVTTAALMAKVHATGRSFHVWTVDNLPDALEAFRRGVDTVTTNCAQRLLTEYRASKPPAP